MKKKLNTLIVREEVNDKCSETKVNLITIKEMIVAYVRFIGKYSQIRDNFIKLYKGCWRYVSGKQFTQYYDDEYLDENANIELCVPLRKKIKHENFKCRVLKGGKALSVIHKGSYETLAKAYKKISDYIKTASIEVMLPSRQIHIKGPGTIFKSNPANYITEVQILVKE